MSIESYDFRKPARLSGELEQQMAAWLNVGLTGVAEKWARSLDTPVAHVLDQITTVRPVDALGQLSDGVVAYRVVIGAEQLSTLVTFPRPLMLTLAAGVLGEPCNALGADRELTAVESSLVEYLVQQLLEAIQASWTGEQPLVVTLKELDPAPKRSRIFKPDDNVIDLSLSMHGPFGAQSWHWLAPQKGFSNLFVRAAVGPGTEQKSSVRAHLESLVGAMPLEVAVRLGGAVLHVSELANLRSGDLVLLDQPVSSPLAVSVAGKTRFLVWPGRVGAKQAFQIESLVER